MIGGADAAVLDRLRVVVAPSSVPAGVAVTGPSNIFRFLNVVWEIRVLDWSFSTNLRFFTETSPESRSAALRLTVDVPFAAALCLSVACSFFQLLERVDASIARRDQVGNPFSPALAEMDVAAGSIGGLFFSVGKKDHQQTTPPAVSRGLALVRKWLFTKGKALEETGIL